MRRAAALAVIVGVAAALLLFRHHRAPDAARTAKPWLLVYNAVSRDVTLLSDPERPSGARVQLGCLGLPQWALRVGQRDGALVLLDPQARAILLLPIDALVRAANGETGCAAAQPRRVPLACGQLPYRGVLDGNRLYVSYFSGNIVEAYDWIGGSAPTLRLAFTLRFAHPESLGLSDLLVAGDTLVVAASGYFCYSRRCPEGHFRAPRLFFVDRNGAAAWPFPEARPANVNSSGLFRSDGGALFVINSGDYGGGYGSLQRVHGDRTLGPEIRLPRAAAPGSAFALDRDTFIVLQLSGEHVFFVDAAGERLRRIARFDGGSFVDLPLDSAALPDRSSSDLQDVVRDPAAPERFFFVDAKREQLVHVELDAPTAALRVLGTTSLATAAYRSAPAWAVWLGR